MPCLSKLKWALDLLTRWPYHKMTYKNPLCSGLKATHSVWEIRWGLPQAQSKYIIKSTKSKFATLKWENWQRVRSESLALQNNTNIDQKTRNQKNKQKPKNKKINKKTRLHTPSGGVVAESWVLSFCFLVFFFFVFFGFVLFWFLVFPHLPGEGC